MANFEQKTNWPDMTNPPIRTSHIGMGTPESLKRFEGGKNTENTSTGQKTLSETNLSAYWHARTMGISLQQKIKPERYLIDLLCPPHQSAFALSASSSSRQPNTWSRCLVFQQKIFGKTENSCRQKEKGKKCIHKMLSKPTDQKEKKRRVVKEDEL